MKYIYLVVGWIAFGLGAIGIILPILPTTPFMLLAGFCFIRGSERAYTWLVNHRIFGKYIADYISGKPTDRKATMKTMALLWVALIISMCLVMNLIMTIGLTVIGVGVSIHLYLRMDHGDGAMDIKED